MILMASLQKAKALTVKKEAASPRHTPVLAARQPLALVLSLCLRANEPPLHTTWLWVGS